MSVMPWCPGLGIFLPSHELKATLQIEKPSTSRSPLCDAQAMDDFHLIVKMCSAHVPPSVLLWGLGRNGGAGPCGSCAVLLSQDQLHTR